MFMSFFKGLDAEKACLGDGGGENISAFARDLRSRVRGGEPGSWARFFFSCGVVESGMLAQSSFCSRPGGRG